MDVQLTSIIVSPDRLRRVNHTKVAELADSISTLGRLINPIIVREESRDRFRLVAGEHRFEAFKLLGKDAIPAVVKVVDDTLEGQLEDEIEEIDENIARSEMTEGEVRLATKRRKVAYMKLAAIRREAKALEEKYAAIEAKKRSTKEKDKLRNAVRDAKKATKGRESQEPAGSSSSRPVNRVAAAEFTADTAAKHGITAKSVERRVREADELEHVAEWAKVDARDLARSSIQYRAQLIAATAIIDEYGAGMVINDGNVHHLLKKLVRRAAKGEQVSIVDFKNRVDSEQRADELSERRSKDEVERYRHCATMLSKAAKAVLEAQDILTAYKLKPKNVDRLAQMKDELRAMAGAMSNDKKVMS